MITQEQIDEGIEYYKEHGCTKATAARYLIKKYGLTENQDNVRVQISYKINTENKVNIGLEKICEEQGINVNDVSNYWYKGQHYLEDEDKLFDKILFGLRLVHGHDLRIAIIPKYDDEK